MPTVPIRASHVPFYQRGITERLMEHELRGLGDFEPMPSPIGTDLTPPTVDWGAGGHWLIDPAGLNTLNPSWLPRSFDPSSSPISSHLASPTADWWGVIGKALKEGSNLVAATKNSGGGYSPAPRVSSEPTHATDGTPIGRGTSFFDWQLIPGLSNKYLLAGVVAFLVLPTIAFGAGRYKVQVTGRR